MIKYQTIESEHPHIRTAQDLPWETMAFVPMLGSQMDMMRPQRTVWDHFVVPVKKTKRVITGTLITNMNDYSGEPRLPL